MGAFKSAHGGDLKDLYLSDEQAVTEKREAAVYRNWDLRPRQLCDLELLLNGAFSPLEGFLNRPDYARVLSESRLGSGVLWPIPVTLDVTEAFAESLPASATIALRDPEGLLIAVMDVDDIWTPDREAEAAHVYGSTDIRNPGVRYLLHDSNPVYLGGRVRGVQRPVHYDFKHLRHSPRELRALFEKLGWRRVVAFQTRGPMHRMHQELSFRAARTAEANLLIHPTVGMTQPGDVDYYTRVRCYEHVLGEYPEQTTTLSLLPLAMRMAGPRETVWHAIVRKNYGCTHFIVGSDHASPRYGNNGESPYDVYAAQDLMRRYQDELDITMVPVARMVYVANRAQYLPVDQIAPGDQQFDISGSELRRRLDEDLEIEPWFTYPAVIDEIRKIHPPRHRQGFTVFFTGLSGSGKSTIAHALMAKLLELGGRRLTLLDGDIVRKHLSSELGFSKAHRNLNILRIGFVASEITKNGGIALCAPIAPYRETRRAVRDMVSPDGGFLEVYVDTPIEVCEQRDRKGLYAKARAGLIKEFTGISDPYEVPEHPEITIDTTELTPDLAAHRIIIKLESLGYIR